MIDVRLMNEKLFDRGTRIVAEIANVPYEQAREYIKQCGIVKTACVMAAKNCWPDEARKSSCRCRRNFSRLSDGNRSNAKPPRRPWSYTDVMRLPPPSPTPGVPSQNCFAPKKMRQNFRIWQTTGIFPLISSTAKKSTNSCPAKQSTRALLWYAPSVRPVTGRCHCLSRQM